MIGFSSKRVYVIMPHHPPNCTLHDNAQAYCVLLKRGEMDRAREGGEEEEENEDEASDVAYVLRTIVALMIKHCQ